jgi:CheY-like chemotaxis protein
MRVLLADDSKTIQLILRNLLWELGIDDVKTVHNGREAIESLSSEEFDLILLDLHMPEANGFEVLPHAEGTPVVVISSDSDHRQIERARDLGARGYIKKPFKRDALDQAIQLARVT